MRIFLVLCLFFGALCLCYILFGHWLVKAIYEGESIEALNRLIEGQTENPLQYYTKIADRIFVNVFVLGGLTLLFCLFLTLGFYRGVQRLFAGRKSNVLLNVFILCLAFIALFFLTEGLVRAYQFFSDGTAFSRSPSYYYDAEFGWKGKQIFGNPSSRKFKIFFIGDSFTAGPQVEEKYMYYNVIRDNLDAEIFVYGGSGYGTLQEYIVLDKYLDYINPDLIVLQVCGNDFINNLWQLERASLYNNNVAVRPYLINGKIEYRFPALIGKSGKFLYLRSRFFHFLLIRIHKLLYLLAKNGVLHSVDQDIEEKGTDLADFKKSVDVTGDLILRFKKRSGGIPIVAFASDDLQPYLMQFRKIFQKYGIEFIEVVPKATRQQEKITKTSLRLKDGTHYNEAGNQLCGKILTEALKKYRLKRSRQ